jgi:hypothetical protein
MVPLFAMLHIVALMQSRQAAARKIGTPLRSS